MCPHKTVPFDNTVEPKKRTKGSIFVCIGVFHNITSKYELIRPFFNSSSSSSFITFHINNTGISATYNKIVRLMGKKENKTLAGTGNKYQKNGPQSEILKINGFVSLREGERYTADECTLTHTNIW
jgi:hypothetical protein